jgi:AAA+ ATPase superfamily predicted ATPase
MNKTTPLNPYIAGNPVGGGEAFIGRADVLREVVRVLRNPHQNAPVLYGQRRIGKTSVLQELVTQLPEKGAYHPAYFNLEDKTTWPLGKVLQELAQTIAHSLD